MVGGGGTEGYGMKNVKIGAGMEVEACQKCCF